MMFRLNVPTRRGVVLNGVLFRLQEERKADTVINAAIMHFLMLWYSRLSIFPS